MIGKQKYTIDLIGFWLVFQTENGYLHLPSEKYKTSTTPHVQDKWVPYCNLQVLYVEWFKNRK